MAIKRARFDRLDSQWVLGQLRQLDTDEGGPLGNADDSVEEALCKVRWTVLWEVEGWWVCADEDDEVVIVWDQHGPMCLWPDWCADEEVEPSLSPTGEIRIVEPEEGNLQRQIDELQEELLWENLKVEALQRRLDERAEQIQELQETLAWRDNLIEALQRQVDDKAEHIQELQDTLLAWRPLLDRQSLGEA